MQLFVQVLEASPAASASRSRASMTTKAGCLECGDFSQSVHVFYWVWLTQQPSRFRIHQTEEAKLKFIFKRTLVQT